MSAAARELRGQAPALRLAVAGADVVPAAQEALRRALHALDALDALDASDQNDARAARDSAVVLFDRPKLWTELTTGRWSVVTTFREGDHIAFVARANSAAECQARALGKLELWVVSHVAAGQPSKCVAADLDLSEPVVSVLLKKGLHKLGLASRHELVELFVVLQGLR